MPVAITDVSAHLGGHASVVAMLRAALPYAEVLEAGRPALVSGSVKEVRSVLEVSGQILDALRRFSVLSMADGRRTEAVVRIPATARALHERLVEAYDVHWENLYSLTPARRASLLSARSLRPWYGDLSERPLAGMDVRTPAVSRRVDRASAALAERPTRRRAAALMDAVARSEAAADMTRPWHAQHEHPAGLRGSAVAAGVRRSLDRAPVLGDLEKAWPGAGGKAVDFHEFRDAIIDGFAFVDPQAGEWARQALTSGWVDTTSRRGRRPEYLTWHAASDAPPVCVADWDGTLSSAYLLAHEVGHVVHQLHMRARTPHGTPAPLVAEFAATFLADAAVRQWAGAIVGRRRMAASVRAWTWMLSAAEHGFERAAHEAAGEWTLTPGVLDRVWSPIADRFDAVGLDVGSWTDRSFALHRPGAAHLYLLATPAAIVAASRRPRATWQVLARSCEMPALDVLARAGAPVGTVAEVRDTLDAAAAVLARQAHLPA